MVLKLSKKYANTARASCDAMQSDHLWFDRSKHISTS